MKTKPTIGAFYQCYKQRGAFEATVKSFRNIYPDSSLVIISDEGDDFSHISNIHGALYRRDQHIGNKTAHYFKDSQGLQTWLERLYFAAQNIKEDYILLLEDDVRVLKPVTNLNYDLNGINPKETLGEEITRFLKASGSKIPKKVKNHYYGGCGGSVIDGNFVRSFLRSRPELNGILEELIKRAKPELHGNYASDYFLSCLILYFGGTLGQYSGFCERWYKSYWLRRHVLRNIEVLHQDKSLYQPQKVHEDHDGTMVGESGDTSS